MKMGLLKKLFCGNEEVNTRYLRIRDGNIAKGFQQARERGVDVPTEPFRIAKMVPLPGPFDGERYWGVADFILVEYPTELGLQVATAFCNMVPQLGFDPYGKVMIGMQYVDRKAGSPRISRLSFERDHPKFMQYVMERDCPERTERASDFLTAAVFQFPSVDHAKEIFSTLFVVHEMKREVTLKLYSIDEAVAKYVTR